MVGIQKITSLNVEIVNIPLVAVPPTTAMLFAVKNAFSVPRKAAGPRLRSIPYITTGGPFVEKAALAPQLSP